MLTILLFRDAKEMEKQQQEKFAIGFAQFSINYNYDSMHKVWIRYDKNEIFATKDLLEIYKKNIMKQTAVEWIKSLFKMKSPCCKKAMKNIGIHEYWGGGESILYECSKCKRQWT